METSTTRSQLPTLWEAFADRSNLSRTLYLLIVSAVLSYFVTFVLSEGLVNPNKFFNRFFKYWPGYALVIPCFGLVWGLVLSVLGTLFRTYLSPRIALLPSKLVRISVVMITGFVLAFIGMTVIDYACLQLFNLAMWSREWHLSVILMSGLFGSAFALLFYADFEKKLLLQQAEKREQALARHRLEGELMNLNLRIRPHFFFNALNTLASLIDKDRVKAQEFLGDLADLFRLSFTHGQDRSVGEWGDEKAVLTAYLTVEQMRFMDRLQWHMAVDASDDAPFPAFLLQPLVENAVHHGISPAQSPGTITIEGSFKQGQWHICITNSLPIGTPQPEIKKGHALWTIQERLNLMDGTLGLALVDAGLQVTLTWRHQVLAD